MNETVEQTDKAEVSDVELDAIIWLCLHEPNYRPPRDRVVAIAQQLRRIRQSST